MDSYNSVLSDEDVFEAELSQYMPPHRRSASDSKYEGDNSPRINNNHIFTRSHTLGSLGSPTASSNYSGKFPFYRTSSLSRVNSTPSPVTHFSFPMPQGSNGRPFSPALSTSSESASWFRATFRAPSQCRYICHQPLFA